MAINEPKEPEMTAGEKSDFSFGSNNLKRRGIEVKPEVVKQIITPGELTDEMDSTKKEAVKEGDL